MEENKNTATDEKRSRPRIHPERMTAEALTGVAELEKQRVQGEIKGQIVDVSTVLTSKLLEREINAQDHEKLIDDVISEIDEGNNDNE